MQNNVPISDFATGPHFIVMPISMANIFYKTNIEDGQKVNQKSAPLITICIF